MKVIIFIGHHKTGSSSLQVWLSSNYYRLISQGVLYPAVESKAFSRNLGCVLKQKDQLTNGKPLNIVEPHNALAFKLLQEETGNRVPPFYTKLPSGRQMFEMIDNQINSLNPHTLILCSEVMSHFGFTAQHQSLKRLSRRLGGHEVTIHCNLRRPDEHISSWHRQTYKFGNKTTALHDDALNSYLDTLHFQQGNLLKPWMKHFPDAKFNIRNFDAVNSNGGSISDFIELNDLSLPDDLIAPGRVNPSVPCALSEIARRSIHELPKEISHGLVWWLARVKKEISGLPSDNQVEMYGSKNRGLLLSRFEPIANELNAITEGAFYSNLSDFDVVRPISDIEAAKETLPKLLEVKSFEKLDALSQSWLTQLEI